MKEIWRDIEGYEGLYQVSSFGRVKSFYTNRILKGYQIASGYLGLRLYKNNIGSMNTIHRIVAEAFIPNPENKPQVNHIDEDKTNNRVDNLEWVTAKENINHGTRTGRVAKKQRIQIIATNIKTGESQEFNSGKECAVQLGVNSTGINHALKGRRKQAGGYTFKYKE